MSKQSRRFKQCFGFGFTFFMFLTIEYYQNYLLDRNKLPSAIIVGVKKAGTRALLNYLNEHPQISAAPQEVAFFNKEVPYWIGGYRWYASRMDPKASDTDLRIEKTPNYFHDRIARRIRKMNPNMKLIIIFRDPVKRIISDYSQLIAYDWRYDGSLERLILDRKGGIDRFSPLVYPSLYAYHLSHWLQYFPPGQIFLVDGDKLGKTPPTDLLRSLEEFLGVESHFHEGNFKFVESKGFYCINSTSVKCLTAGKGRRHASIDKETQQKLTDFFGPENEKLFKLIGIRYDW